MASFVDSMAAPLSVINALIVALGLRRKDELSEHFRLMEGIWDEYRVYVGKDRVCVAVIGGGAAGMMAALQAAWAGGAWHCWKRNEKLGKKIYITGKGRCNVTNVAGHR